MAAAEVVVCLVLSLSQSFIADVSPQVATEVAVGAVAGAGADDSGEAAAADTEEAITATEAGEEVEVETVGEHCALCSCTASFCYCPLSALRRCLAVARNDTPLEVDVEPTHLP